MAGPTATILTNGVLRATLKDTVGQAIDGADGNAPEFYVDDRPFIVSYGEEYPGQLADLGRSGLADVWPWVPDDMVTFSAMCNQQLDHVLLAGLCIEVAERVAGLIDFGGSVPVGPHHAADEIAAPVCIEQPDGLDGVLLATPYMAASGRICWSHFGDTTMLRAWLRRGDLRLVK